MIMRVADYLVDRLYRAGAEHAFLITGGMIMHLTDALLQHGQRADQEAEREAGDRTRHQYKYREQDQ